MAAVRAFADLYPFVKVVGIPFDGVIYLFYRRELGKRVLDHGEESAAAARGRVAEFLEG